MKISRIVCLLTLVFATAFTNTAFAAAKDTVVVDKPINLAGKVFNIEAGKVIKVTGKGHLSNGILNGKNNVLVVETRASAIGKDIKVTGSWRCPEVYDTWFDFDNSQSFVSNQIIKNIFALSNDNDFCHIYFIADRKYYFELPYKGKANLGDLVSFEMQDGKKMRNYKDLYDDKYADLRIFVIPSNTHVSFNNYLQMLPTGVGAYFVFWEYGKKNITVDGSGTISGEVLQHRYDSPIVKNSQYFGEWGHIFACRVCDNFKFEDITLENSFGDCINFVADYYSPEIVGRRWSDGLVVDGVTIRNARRNGISVAARNVLIKNTIFEGCGTEAIKGTAPMAAIDFESDGIKTYPETGNENVVMDQCVFIGNQYDVSSTNNNAQSYGKTATTIKNCVFTSSLRLNTTNWLEFYNCIIPDITNFKGQVSAGVPIRHTSFRKCIIQNMPKMLKTSKWENSFDKETVVERIY